MISFKNVHEFFARDHTDQRDCESQIRRDYNSSSIDVLDRRDETGYCQFGSMLTSFELHDSTPSTFKPESKIFPVFETSDNDLQRGMESSVENGVCNPDSVPAGKSFNRLTWFYIDPHADGYLAPHFDRNAQIERMRLKDLQQLEPIWVWDYKIKDQASASFDLNSESGVRLTGQVLAINVVGEKRSPLRTMGKGNAFEVSENGTLHLDSIGKNLLPANSYWSWKEHLTYRVFLAASNGVISLDSFSNVQFEAGDGIGDRFTSFVGTAKDIRNALGGIQFAPLTNYEGPASLVLITDIPQSKNGIID